MGDDGTRAREGRAMRKEITERLLNDGIAWFESQAGRKNPSTDERFHADNLLVAAASVMAATMGRGRLQDWIDRNRFLKAWHARQQSAFTKKWNPVCRKMLICAISGIDACSWLTRFENIPLVEPETAKLSAAKLAALAKARETKAAKRQAAEESRKAALQRPACSGAPSLTAPKNGQRTTGFIGSENGKTSTFGNRTDPGKSSTPGPLGHHIDLWRKQQRADSTPKKTAEKNK